jgi:hypothetical protein
VGWVGHPTRCLRLRYPVPLVSFVACRLPRITGGVISLRKYGGKRCEGQRGQHPVSVPTVRANHGHRHPRRTKTALTTVANEHSTPAPLTALRSACDGPGVRKPLGFISPISGTPKRSLRGQFSSMTANSNSRISVTTTDTSSEPAQPSLFEKKTNKAPRPQTRLKASSASVGQSFEEDLYRGIVLGGAIGEPLACPSELSRQVAHVLAEAANLFRRACEVLGPELDSLGLR